MSAHVRTALASLAACALLVATCAVPARAVVYAGVPDLALTAAMIDAAGGPKHFSSRKLFAFLAGPHAAAERARLTEQFGAAAVSDTFDVFDYSVDDVLRVAAEQKLALPAGRPDPKDAKAVALALYAAGETPAGKWDVGYMLEHLISHPIHHVMMMDVDAAFGSRRNAAFHIVVTEMMYDLMRVYDAPPAPPVPPAAPAAAATPFVPAPIVTPAVRITPYPADGSR